MTKSSKSRCWNRCKNLCLIDCVSPYIATGSHIYTLPKKGYNQTRLGLEFQIKQNSYTKQTLITMENIKLSSTTDWYTITSQSATPALFFITIGRPPFTAIGNHQH